MRETFAGKVFCEFINLQTSKSNLGNGVTQLQNQDKVLRCSHSEKLGSKRIRY